MKTAATTIEEYIADQPEAMQKLLELVRAAIRNAAPGAVETISYAIPTFKLGGIALVHFAAAKHHIGLYATPTGHAAFKDELSGYKQGKGSVQFPLGEPMPLELISRITKFRVTEVSKKLAAKKKNA